MIRSDTKKMGRQRGSGLVEFCFTIPVLLLIAGATIDLSRYMRFLQITTFVSQETASQIYRKCSDITIYNPPVLGSNGLVINTALTSTAIKACVERVQSGAQQLLNRSVGRAAVSSKVFRWKMDQPDVSTSCASLTAMGTNVTMISAPVRMSTEALSDETGTEMEDGEQENGGPGSNRWGWPPISIPSTSGSNGSALRGSGSLPSQTELAITTPGIVLKDTGIYQTKNGSSASERLLVSPSALCQKGRVATVEVSYAFEPVVKFLPLMMMKLNTDGSQRETTVL
jgi:hypothetical protein